MCIQFIFTVVVLLLLAKSTRGDYYKKNPGTNCRTGYQAKNLGASFKDAQECGEAALRDSACTGTEIMWPNIYKKWGCRCCSRQGLTTDVEFYNTNPNWDLYDYYDPSNPPLVLNTCPPEKAELVVMIRTDSFPLESSWSLENKCDKNAEVVRGGPYDKPHHDYVERHCVPDARYQFNLTDWFGDGICCDYDKGGYSVIYNGERVSSGSSFGYYESTIVGPSSCPEPAFLRLPNHQCARFKANDLGYKFKNVQECAAAARLNPSCTGNEIMWTENNSESWGCSCCKIKPSDQVYVGHPEWDIWQYRDKLQE